jgi:hypothetical protein
LGVRDESVTPRLAHLIGRTKGDFPMNMIQRMTFRWNQPHNEGKRLMVSFVLTLSALAACIWALSQLIPIILS